MAIQVSNVRDVADGTQAGQFEVGDRSAVPSFDDLDPVYKHLLDEPITAVIAVIGKTGRANLTPVWFDYEGDLVLLNLASHRKKVDWLRNNPQATFMLMNPANPYHWMSIKGTVSREVHEDDLDEGERVTAQIDKMWGEVHPAARRLRAAGPGPRRAPRPVRVHRRLDRDVRVPLSRHTTTPDRRSGRGPLRWLPGQAVRTTLTAPVSAGRRKVS